MAFLPPGGNCCSSVESHTHLIRPTWRRGVTADAGVAGKKKNPLSELPQAGRAASSSFSSDRSGTETSGGDSEDYYVDNPTPQIIPPPVETGAVGEKHVIVMVGLPARGKTHMARR